MSPERDSTPVSAPGTRIRGDRPRTLGFVGLGHMGGPMARRLVDAGWDVAVYNRTASKAAPLVAAGAHAADSLATLRACDVVVSMVGTDNDLRAITSGPGGLLDSGGQVPLLVDCSTVSADVSNEVMDEATAKGSDLLAAPVAGGPSVIADGGLAMVCSGTRSSFEYARPVLETIAPKLIYVGEAGASRHVKILHNLVAAVLVHSLAEASVLAESLGIRRQDLLEFISAGAVGSRFIGYKSQAMNDLDFKAAFTSSLMLKDIDLVLDLARSIGVQALLTRQTRATVADLITAGRGDLDIAALLLHIADANGVRLHDAP